jgi:ABC-type glycerol-3-phosphate transport system substrate-binding protein
MKKMLKMMAILLVIATVVFAAGCSSKKAATTEKGATEQVTGSTAIAEQNSTQGEATVTVTEDLSGMPGNNTTEPEDNFTEAGNNSSDVGEGELNDSEIPNPTMTE